MCSIMLLFSPHKQYRRLTLPSINPLHLHLDRMCKARTGYQNHVLSPRDFGVHFLEATATTTMFSLCLAGVGTAAVASGAGVAVMSSGESPAERPSHSLRAAFCCLRAASSAKSQVTARALSSSVNFGSIGAGNVVRRELWVIVGRS